MKKIMFAMGLLAAAVCSAAEAPVTLALQAYTFKGRSMVETIETAKRLGFTAIELTPVQKLGGTFEGSFNTAMTSQTRVAVRDYLARCGLKVPSYGVVNEKDEAGWRKQFEFARDLNIGTILTEPSPPQLPLIDRLAQEYKIRVMIHNHAKTSPWWDPAFMAQQVGACSKWIGAGADIGHWVAAGVDPADGIKKLAASRIFALHFVDVNTDAKPVPYGTGVGHLDQVLATVKAQGVPVVLTCEYEQWKPETEANVRACVVWFEQIQKK